VRVSLSLQVDNLMAKRVQEREKPGALPWTRRGPRPPDPHPLRQPRQRRAVERAGMERARNQCPGQRRKQRAVTLRLAPDHKQTSLSTSPGEHAGREAVE